MEKKDSFYYLNISSLTLKLIYLMMEDAVLTEGKKGIDGSHPGLNLRNEISRYLQNHILQIHSTADLSTALGYSREHLCRMVRKYHGTTCKELIDTTRVNYAIHMMKESSCTLQEVSEMSGSSSYRNFVTLFQRHYKMHPRDFRPS